MTLTHKQIAEMSCTEVNKKIAIRLGEYEEWFTVGILPFPTIHTKGVIQDYCHNWSHAGLLLDELVNSSNSSKDITFLIDHWFYSDQYPAYAVNKAYTFYEDGHEWLRFGKVRQQGHTLTEAIARTWLEWYEVKNAEKNEVKHE